MSISSDGTIRSTSSRSFTDLDTGEVEASITLASLRMTALVTGVVGTAQVPQVPGYTDTSETISSGDGGTRVVKLFALPKMWGNKK